MDQLQRRNPASKRSYSPVKCLICASRLVPVSTKISVAGTPCKSSTTCVSKTSLPDVLGACSAWSKAAEPERGRRALHDDELVDAVSRLEAPASWRRSSVVAIVAGECVRCRTRRKRRRCRRLQTDNSHSWTTSR